MNAEKAREMFHFTNDNEKVYFAQIPRCVILDRTISTAAKNIYYYLIARCDMREGPFTWIGQEAMAEDLQMSRENINRRIKDLLKLGLIDVRKYGNFQNVYHIKNVAEIYGDQARDPWQKRDKTASCDVEITPAVTLTSHQLCRRDHTSCDVEITPAVTLTSHKVEEEKNKKEEEETKEKKRRPHTPSSGGALSVSDPLDLELADRWLEFAKSETGMKKTSPSWNRETWAKDIAKTRRVSGLNYEQMGGILLYISTNDFWRQNALSPKGLLLKNKADVRKIDTILGQIKNSRQFKENRPITFNEGDVPF